MHARDLRHDCSLSNLQMFMDCFQISNGVVFLQSRNFSVCMKNFAVLLRSISLMIDVHWLKVNGECRQ